MWESPTATLNSPSLICLTSSGSIDNTFSSQIFGEIKTLSEQPDGKIIVGGNLHFEESLGTFHNVGRILANGQLDTSFNPGVVDFSEVNASTIREDGKILIGGRFTLYNLIAANNIACLNPDGSVDDSFVSGIGFNHHVFSLDAQTDNTFFAGGDYTYYNTTDADSLLLINSDGTTNSGFIPGRVVNSQISLTAVCAQTDDKIIVGGIFNHYHVELAYRMVGFNANGTEDTSLNTGSGFKNGTDDATVTSMARQPDGKIVVGGDFTSYNDVPVRNLIRLNADGSIDTPFFNGGLANLNYLVQKIVIQPDGKILVTGSGASAYNSGKVVRLNADGSTDTSFNIPVLNQLAEALALQPDGKIIVAGSFSTCNMLTAKGIVRLNIDGTIDNSLVTGTGFDTTGTNYARCLALQPDGKILVGGWLRSYNGVTTIKYIVRLNADGTIDPLFNFGTGFNSSVSSIALDSDNKILVGGIFSSYNGTNCNKLVRLNPDGTLDPQFITGTGFNNYVSNIAVLSGGKIIVTGAFSVYNGTIAKQVIKLNGNAVLGTRNQNFEINTSLFPNPVKDVLHIKLQSPYTITSYTIFDATGKAVKTSNKIQDTIAVENLSNGIYLLRIETEYGHHTEKFIKE